MKRFTITSISVGILLLFLVSQGLMAAAPPAKLAVAQSASSTQTQYGTWTSGASSPTPKMESAYTALGDKIYIIAGYGETGKRNKNSVEVYDTKTDAWTTAAPVPVNLNHAAAASHNGRIYLVGGFLDNKI